MAVRLRERYKQEIVPALREQFQYPNVMAVPRLEKIVLNMGIGGAKDDIKAMDRAMEELAQIAGQRPEVRRARKSIANFKLREGLPIGCRVTLRGTRMYEFLGASEGRKYAETTGAHEFFHSVQFAYNYYMPRWFMEASATWMERMVYDGSDQGGKYQPRQSGR